MISKISSYQFENSPIYPEVRRLFKDRITRIAILLLLGFTLIYSFSTSTCTCTSTHHTVPATQTQCITGSSEGESGLPNTNAGDHVVDLSKPGSAVGKVHAVFGEINPVYERALRLHEIHAKARGHPMFVLRERVLSGLWSKPAYILNVMLQELAKPEDQRLEWLLWIDADIVVMNPNIPLDVFIPPTPEFNYVNMLVTNDRHGLNNGCFLVRITPWSVKLFSAVIAFHTFKPEVKLQYSEQSALEEMIEDNYWRRSVVHVPQYWFNAYPNVIRRDKTPRPHEYRLGGLQIHFAGNRDGKRPERMDNWMSIAEQDIAPYSIPLETTGLEDDINAFWTHLSEERTKKGITLNGSE